ncbi:MAG: hypothetical protein A4E55_00664 [Pelotomaculum sp. PtaU1.Bin035]|nr:MAG: hypothetical protein A4E55_00664 [Pelotomaculum sp. PtaU1.Bin035]
MKIMILDEVLECTNEVSAVESMFQHVNQLIAESNLALSHMDIDSVEVYENYYQYVLDHLHTIQVIDIIMKTMNDLILDALLSTESYLARSLPEIRLLVDEFYQGPGKISWVKFEQLLEGLQWMLNMLATIGENKEWYHNKEQYRSIAGQLSNQIGLLQEAFENKDMTLLSDLLGYEIVPSLENLEIKIKETLDHIRNGVNLN